MAFRFLRPRLGECWFKHSDKVYNVAGREPPEKEAFLGCSLYPTVCLWMWASVLTVPQELICLQVAVTCAHQAGWGKGWALGEFTAVASPSRSRDHPPLKGAVLVGSQAILG